MSTSRHRTLVVVLLLALVVTNAWWLSRAILVTADDIATAKYQGTVEYELRETAKDALTALPALASGVAKDEVVRRVAQAVGEEEPFEKEGVTVVGWLTLRFDDSGRLVEARGTSDPDIVFVEDEPGR